MKIVIVGGDAYFNLVLRPYVEQFSVKSHDWQKYIKFLFIPLGKFTLTLNRWVSVMVAFTLSFCD